MKDIAPRILWTLALMFVAHAILDVAVIARKGGLPWLKQFYFGKPPLGTLSATKRDIFEASPVKPGSIVVLGDSLIALSILDEQIADSLTGFKGRIVLRGIEGETIEEMEGRFEECLKSKPSHIILCGGINDIQQRVPHGRTRDALLRMSAKARTVSPETSLFALEMTAPHEELYQRVIRPRSPGIHRPTAEEVAVLNGTLGSCGFSLIEVPLADRSGYLREEFAKDGLHWTGRAYVIAADRIARAIRPAQLAALDR